jgi:glycosyltransferase involved in cell wall biosynthesis
MNPLVSVVIPTYNRGQVIEQAIQTVMNQTYYPIEIIVLDDGSTDNTLEIVKKYPEVKYYYQKNKGAAQARNNGVLMAEGGYIAFLDSDDIWLPWKLELQMKTIKKLQAPIIGSRKKYIKTAAEINLQPKKINESFHYITFCEQLKRTWCVPSTMVVHKDFFKSFGGFDPTLKIAEDWDLWLKIAYKEPIPRMKEVLTYNFLTKGSLSENRLEKYLYDLRVIKKWNPMLDDRISFDLYMRWCLAFITKRILKLRLHAGKSETNIFWKMVKKELFLPGFTLKIVNELLR